MGLCVAQIRVMYLLRARLDLEYKIMLVTQAKSNLSASVTDLMQIGNDMSDPDNPTAKLLQQRQAKLKVLEEKLDSQLAAYNTRLKMIETEYESAVAVRDKNIERSFSYGR